MLTQSIWLTQYLQRGIRQWGEVENLMVSVERIQEFIKLKPEADNDEKTPINWPESGKVEFQKVSLK